MKKNNILQLLEMHVDKIVLGLMILISLVLLWKYVIGNPYGAEIDGRKRGPGDIDAYVKTQADDLLARLEEEAQAVPYDKTYFADYDKLVQSPISKISSLAIPYPGGGETAVEEERMYALPEIPPLNEVAAANVRGAAQLPVNEVKPDNPYLTGEMELGDLDLVTVSATFNTQSLLTGFQQSFIGPLLRPAWRDANLAKPVFARLELERRELNPDGTWSKWAQVPRTKIDMYKKLLEELPLTTDKLQFGVNIMVGQFSEKAVQEDILQPQTYSFMVSRMEWMPPSYLEEAIQITEKSYLENQKKLRQEQIKLNEAENSRRPDGQPRPTRERETRPQPQRGRDRNAQPVPAVPAVSERPVARERTIDDVRADMKKALLESKDPQTMKESLLVWAHDDTVDPGRTYQYRLRLGVFNPIAGKNWFNPDQAKYKDQVVLWSNYAESANVYVPKRVHVFPMELIEAKNSVNATEGVKVEVAKYNLGQWCTQTFDIFPGQIIGHKASYTPKINPVTLGLNAGGATATATAGNPSQIAAIIVDFTTPFTMVDINRTVTWGKDARNRNQLDMMLYHDPKLAMQQSAIGDKKWDSALKDEYKQVQEEIKRAAEQLQDGSSQTPVPTPPPPV